MLGEFASWRIFDRPDGFGPHTSMGVFDGVTCVAAMIYHNYSRENGVVELSGAASTKRWLTKPVLWEMYNYPFNQLGCQIVVQRNSAEDKPLERMLTAYGFVGYRIPRLRGRDEDEIIFTLTEETWRSNGYHEVRDGRKVRA